MKKTQIILLLSITIFLSNCKKDNNDDDNNNNNNNNPSGVIIKGKISGSKKGGDSLSLSDATKVIITWGKNSYAGKHFEIADIVNNTFSIGAYSGTASALIFLDNNYQYIGNLCTEGIEMLPLGHLSDGEATVIDLSTLTLVGNHVIPSHDPFGNEIIITPDELAIFAEVDAFYESLSKNLDTDNNGSIDLLDYTQLFISSRFNLYAGHWGTDSNPVAPIDTSNYYVSYAMEVSTGSGLNAADESYLVLSGPVDNPYTNISLLCLIQNTSGGFYAAFKRDTIVPPDNPWGSTFVPFRKGMYTMTINGSDAHTFEFCNIDAKYNLIIAAPTMHTNSEGKVTSITIDFRLPNNAIINPENVLTKLMCQMTDTTGLQFYDSPWLNSQTGFTTITMDTPVDISALRTLSVSYGDLLGNSYAILWD